jgi:hypothetical protein
MTAAVNEPVIDKNIIQLRDGSRKRMFGKPNIRHTGLGRPRGFSALPLGFTGFEAV